jgi:hypothetical protein
MEPFKLDLQSKNLLKHYRQHNHVSSHEIAILDEILHAIECGDTGLVQSFNEFGDALRVIIMNIHAYRKNCEFGFTDIVFDDYGWMVRPEFLDMQVIKFGNVERYSEYSTLTVGRGLSPLWSYGLSCNFGTAGSSFGLSVYGKKFNNLDSALNTGIAELKKAMTEKLGHADTINYKQSVINGTLRSIQKYEFSKVQLSLF